MNERKRLYEAIQLMASRNDVIQDTHGNVSVSTGEDVESIRMWIKPSGVPYSKIKEKDISELVVYEDLIQEIVSGKKPSVDTVHHAEIYLTHPWVKAICHTHSPYAVAFAITGLSILPHCTEHSDYFGKEIRCLPYHNLDEWGRNVVLRQGERAVILGRHGALTFSTDPVDAVNLAIQLENVARKTHLALELLPNIRPMVQEEVERWHERYNNVYGQR